MSDDMVRLHTRLMGSAEISVGGLPLVLNQLKSRALLYYLAATGQSHTATIWQRCYGANQVAYSVGTN